jgi:YesN/AraC family two-component response regulator
MSTQLTLRFLSPPVPYFITCKKGFYLKGEGHPNRKNIGVFDLLIVYKGSLHIGEGNQKYIIGEGQYLILLPNAYHYSISPCQEETQFYWLHFQTSESWIEIHENENNHHRDSLSIKSNKREHINEFITNHYYFHIPKCHSIVFPETIYNKLEQLSELEQKTLPSDRWIQQLIFQEILREFYGYHSKYQNQRALEIAEITANYIKQNYHKPITNTLLHEVFHLHPNYISRCMHKVFACTPLEYLYHYRIERAKFLLKTTMRRISNISEEVGFEDPAYFTRYFQKHIGTTPTKYRKKFIKDS